VDSVAPHIDDGCDDKDDERGPAQRRAGYAEYLFELLAQFIAILAMVGIAQVIWKNSRQAQP